MKKIIMLLMIFMLLFTVACREKSTSEQTSTQSENVDETTPDTESVESETTVTVEESEPFVQTGSTEESVTLTLTGGDPSTIVVDKGDLVTLTVTSERVQPTQLYNEELGVDQLVGRGDSVAVTIEASKEGIFYFTDSNTNESLFKFMIAGMTFEAPEDTETTTPIN